MAQYISDGTASFIGGQDAYHVPDRIRPDAYAKGINVTTRRGVLGPRSGWFACDLDYADTLIETRYHYSRPIESVFESGKFQAFIPYVNLPGYYIIVVICGRIFRVNVDTRKTILLSDTIKVNQYAPRINWSYAGRYIVLFDFPDYPVIIDDTEVRRADPNNLFNGNLQPEVPVSVLGTYNQNRLFVANEGNEFTAGDPVGSLATPDAPITFTESLTPAAPFNGQAFSLGTQYANEPITAMGFLQTIDTSTGVGPLFVATENAVYSYRTDIPRADWESTQFGSLLLFNAGIAGPRAVVNVNSDLMFLSGEGKIHALSSARNDTRKWGNVSISREVENWLVYNDPSLRKYACLGYFDNRIFITANPHRVQALDVDGRPVSDYAHGGFVVLALDNVASLTQDQTPVWDGLWTGVRPMDIAVLGDRCFVISKDPMSRNKIYELKRDSHFDFVNGREKYIQSTVYTREYDFSYRDQGGTISTGQDVKYLHTLNLTVKDLQGKARIEIEQRPSHVNNFYPWRDWNHTAPFCEKGRPQFFNGFSEHNIRDVIFGAPSGFSCDPVNEAAINSFKKLQLRLKISARKWRLDDISMKAVLQPSNATDTGCGERPAIAVEKQCNSDWVNPVEDVCE